MLMCFYPTIGKKRTSLVSVIRVPAIINNVFEQFMSVLHSNGIESTSGAYQDLVDLRVASNVRKCRS